MNSFDKVDKLIELGNTVREKVFLQQGQTGLPDTKGQIAFNTRQTQCRAFLESKYSPDNAYTINFYDKVN